MDAQPISVVLGKFKSRAWLVARSRATPDSLYVTLNGTLGKCHAARNGVAVDSAAITALRILVWLACANGRPVHKSELIDLLYSERADGGPEMAHHLLTLRVGEARTIGAALGIIIETHSHNGYAARMVSARGA